MRSDEFPSSFRDPQYVSTLVAVLATGTLFFYLGLTDAGPTVQEAGFVLLAVLLPAGIAHEAARRWL